ncbi:hypothetical protein ACQPZF_29410 [Actinosynnema sp. CS-041913]|uniref:hypothetical protein n=1 Tax=Actinosynnema sp. CS-041913 TaxID=3239917 RepID=UPI003D8DB964
MSRLRGGLLVVLALLATGCARKVDTASDGGADLSLVPTPVSTPTGPTYVPPTGACQVRFEIPEPAPATTPPPAPTTSRALPGDMPPNHVDNRSWRVRKALKPEVHAAAVAVAEQVRPGVEALCNAGSFDREATRAVFSRAGQPKVWVTGMASSYSETPPAGVVFVLAMEGAQGTGCVLGHLHPGRDGGPGQVLVSVDGTTGEGSCYEPPSH